MVVFLIGGFVMDGRDIALIILVAFMLLMAYMGEIKKRKTCTKETEGVILYNEHIPFRKIQSKEELCDAPVIQYYVNGQKYERVGPRAGVKYKRGKTVRIKYDPENPDDFYVVDGVWKYLLYIGILGVILAIAIILGVGI